MALLLLVITAYQLNAQSPYGLTVAGKDVTASNASNILKGIPNASGVMSYDKETKTLTLENVVLECKSYVNAIQTEESMDDLTIQLRGENVITHHLGRIEFNGAKATITGKGGSLKVLSKGPAIFVGNGGSLYIQGGCAVEARGDYGICGEGREFLQIDGKEGTTVKAKGDYFFSLCDFSDIKLVDCEIVAPLGARIVDGNVHTSEEVVIAQVAKDYQIKLRGVAVTEDNHRDILGDGKAAYDPKRAILTLKALTLESSGATPALEAATPITINVEGDCSLTSDASAVLLSGQSFISGQGSLKVISKEDKAVVCSGALSIKGITGDFRGKTSGLLGSGAQAPLTVQDAKLTLLGSEEGSLHGFSSLQLEGVYVVSPEGVTVRDGSLYLGDKICTSEVIIDKFVYYPLYVAGIQASSANCKDICGDGSVSFDPEKRILTLNNFKYVAPDMTQGVSVMSAMGDIVVELKGKNEINTPYMGMVFTSNGVIRGSGSLDIKSSSQALVVNGVEVRIEEGPQITLSGEDVGLFGFQEWGGVIIFNNASVTVEQGGIVNLTSIVFEECRIVTPKNAEILEKKDQYSRVYYSVGVNGERYKDKIEIASTRGVESIQPEDEYEVRVEQGALHVTSQQAATLQIFDMMGARVLGPVTLDAGVAHTYRDLPLGVLILQVGNSYRKVLIK